MKHPNAALLEKLYADFAKGDLEAMLAPCADQMTFQVPGKSKLAGKYTKSSFAQGYATKLAELSGGTFSVEVHDILASDLHAAVLATDRLTRAGKTIEFRTVHIWRFEGGKPVAWYEYPRDLYQFDAVWS
jgi:ketosteroid isomerase-like protein